MTVTDIDTLGGGLSLGSDSPVEFVHGSTIAVADIVVEWDFDGDGDFDEPDEDITSRLVSVESMTGRDFPSALTGKAGPGQLKLTVRNDDDRFSYFNADSPLVAPPFALKTGRRIRVRTAESTPDDPVLLARDRFNRPDGTLGTTETGQAWTAEVGTWAVRGEVAAALGNGGTAYATIDVGTTDHYAQASLRQLIPAPVGASSRNVGVVVRWTDANNYSRVYVDTDPSIGVVIRDVAAGVGTNLATYPLSGWEGMTIGCGVVGQTITAYVNGAPVASATLTGAIDGTRAGLHSNWPNNTGRSPELDDFHVWSHVAGEIEGVLWTGTVESIDPAVNLGPNKTAAIGAAGVLKKAAGTDIAAPRLPIAGVPTGLLVGDAMARARLLHPPAPLDVGGVTTGPIGIADGKALDLARQFEETERGFLHETNEGYAGFTSAANLAGSSPAAWFSDDPAAGQFGYHHIRQLDHKGQIVNRVTAGVAADSPAGITVTTTAGSSHVEPDMPATVNPGDLLVVFAASTVNDNRDWLVPLWWTQHREAKAALGMRVYSHFCDGTEGGTTVRFYNNAGASPGLWLAKVYRIENWYEAANGVAMGDPVSGGDPGPLVHGWGRAPTLFIIGQAGIGSTAGGNFSSDFNPPDGYGFVEGVLHSSGAGNEQYDCGLATGYKIDCSESEDPTEFFALSGYTIRESVMFAVRGYNGPHTKATLQNPQTTGGDGRFVTVEDLDSQDAHEAIRPHPEASDLFATEAAAEAYGDALIGRFAEDRPIISISFYAHLGASYRAQAIRRRVGDKIALTANGDTGLGIDGAEFVIESIDHSWSAAGKLWDVTWELSPA
jgi:hypothetical protein